MKYLSILIAFIALPVFAATDYDTHANAVVTLDTNAKALQVKQSQVEIERQRTMQALAAKLDSKDALILGIVESLGARIQGGSFGTMAQAAAPQIAPPSQPIPECGFTCFVKGVAGAFLGTVERLAPLAGQVVQARYGFMTADRQGQYNRDIQVNAQNTNAAMFNTLGNTSTNIANGGFAMGSILGSKPSATVNNYGNNTAIGLFDSTASVAAPITNTNNCPGASGGNGAPSGSTGDTGNGGTAPTGTAGQSGATGATGTGGTGTAGAVNCNAGK